MAEKTFHSITLPGQDTARVPLTAAEFSTSVAYKVKDYCTYQGKLYRCTTAHAAGAWNAAHFTETNIDNEFDRKLDIPISQANAPANPRVGDLWIDNDENSPIYNVDTSPTLGSTNAVQSGGTKVALNSLDSRKMEHGVITGDFSASVDYRIGDLVFYATTANEITTRTLYRCTTDHNAAAWNAAHFTATTLEVELQKIRESEADTDMIGDLFGAKSIYAVGDYCIYNDNLYRCIREVDNSSTSTPAFDPEDWTQVKLANDVSNLNSVLNQIINNEPLIFFGETVSGTRTVLKNVNIPSGAYDFSCELTSSDTDNTRSLVAFYNGSSTVLNLLVNRNEQFNKIINLDNDVTAIYFYAGRSFVDSEGDTFTYSNVEITQQTKLSKEIAKKIEIVTTANIENNAVTIEKAGFFEKVYSANLFDPETMATDQAWAYTSSPTTGGTVNIISNQYTNTYTALKIPLHENINNVSIIRYSGTGGSIYSYYFTNVDSSCLSYEYDVNYNLASGKTLTVPSGAAYLYITLKNTHNFATAMLMISATAEPVAYEKYAMYLTIPGLQVESETGEWEHNATLSLPDKYELVVGDTFELFYQGIVKAAHWDDFDVEVTCAKGNAFERKFVYTPAASDIGNVMCVITLYDPYHKQMDSKTITLVVKAKASSPGSQKVVLYVGDSLTNGGHAPGEFKRRLVGSGGTPEGDALSNITFIGTCSNGYVDYEGYGGWTWNSYNTANSSNAYMWITIASHDKTEIEDQHSIYQASNGTEWKLETIEAERIKIIRTTGSAALPASGTLTWISGGTHHSDIVYSASAQAAGNPFWNESEGKVDFSTYATARGVSSIDYVYVLLGWNGSGASEENTKAYVRTFIDNILVSFPNCKIVLLGIQCPARDGLAMNYGATGILAHFYSALNHVCNLNTWYADVASEYQNVSFVNIAGQFDTKYNMPSTSVNVNTRNSAKVTIQSNGVHPLTSGYYQIADACWRDFHHKLQE